MSNYNITNILWPTDFSDPSLDALPVACEMAKRFDALLWAVHVIDPPPKNSEWSESSKYYVSLPLEEQLNREKQNLVKLLEDKTAKAGIRTQALALIGEVPETIVKTATQEGMGLIVIATHGRSGVKRLVFGSVTEHVIRNAECPVVSVRSKER